jgi:hypothetical protein
VLATVDNQNCPFYGIVKNVKRALPLRSSRRDGQTIYMEHPIRNPDQRVMPSGRCFNVGSFDPLSEVPRNLGAESRNFRQT